MIYIICLQGISDQNNNIKTTNNRANEKKKNKQTKKKTSRYQILAKMWTNRNSNSLLKGMQ